MAVKIEEKIIECYRRFLVEIFSGISWAAKIRPGIDEALLISRCDQVIESLPKRKWQMILRLRFGLDDGERKSLEMVGWEFNWTTKQNISFLIIKVLRRLSHPSRSKHIREFIVLRNG